MRYDKSPVTLAYTSYLDPLLADADVHDVYSTPISSGEIVFSLLLALIVGLVDLWLTLSVMGGKMETGIALAIHIVVIVVGYIILGAKRQTGMDTRASSMTLLLLMITGFFGAFGAILMIFSHMVFRRDSLTFKEWVNFIYPRPTPSLGEEIYDDIDLKVDEHAAHYDVLPFMDIIRLGTVAQKREVINQVVQNFNPRFASVLQEALKDNSLSVRTLAATSISRLEKQLQAREQKLKQVLQHSEQTPELLLAAARFYDDYAFSGIIDSERKEHYIKEAYDFYQRYIRRRSQDMRAAAWVGRLLVRSGQLEKAASWLKQLIGEGRTDGYILSWYMEVLFRLRKLSELRQFVRTHASKLEVLSHDEHFSPLADTIQFWLKGEARA